MCSLVAHDRMQDNKQDDGISIGDIVIPNDGTVKALKSLGATINFIDVWLHNFVIIILIEVSLIELQWSRCSKRYLKMLRKNLNWFDTGPWHNKNICSKLYGTTFEGFITQARTDRYNIFKE